MNRREFLAIAAAAMPLGACVSLRASQPRLGMLYLYGRIEIPPSVLATIDLDALAHEFHGMRDDITRTLLRCHKADNWSIGGQPESEVIQTDPNYVTLMKPATTFRGDPQPKGRSRYLQPISTGWMDKDGQIITKMRDRACYEAIWYMYARLQREPAEWALTEANIFAFMTAEANQLVIALLHRTGRL